MNDMFTKWQELSSKSIQNGTEFGEIAKEALTRLTESNTEALQLFVKAGTSHLGAMAQTKDVTTLIATQAELNSELGNQFVDTAKLNAAIAFEAQEKAYAAFEGFNASAKTKSPSKKAA
jgi:hypothetical protein